jgi:hypothetical protein
VNEFPRIVAEWEDGDQTFRIVQGSRYLTKLERLVTTPKDGMGESVPWWKEEAAMPLEGSLSAHIMARRLVAVKFPETEEANA